MIRLERFEKVNYQELISWADSEEKLLQFAGSLFTYPLTAEQLDISLSNHNRIAFRVVENETNNAIGHCEALFSENSVIVGRVLIGDEKQRGKGMGKQMIRLLLEYLFSKKETSVVVLYVFDWNTSAIKCYESTGFQVTPGIKLERKIKGDTWIAIQMTLDRNRWENFLQRNA
jgi:RimJ/RimL family protein N-acetyltransferase